MRLKKSLLKSVIVFLEATGIKHPFFMPTSETLKSMGKPGCEELYKVENLFNSLIKESSSYEERIFLYSSLNLAIKAVKKRYSPTTTDFGYDPSLLQRYVELFEGKYCLDYGCGYGNSAMKISSLAKHVLGIDASKQCKPEQRPRHALEELRI